MQSCGLSQGARDVTSLPDHLCHDLTGIVDRLQAWFSYLLEIARMLQ